VHRSIPGECPKKHVPKQRGRKKMIKRLANKFAKKSAKKTEKKVAKIAKKTTAKKTTAKKTKSAPVKTIKNTRKKNGSERLFDLIEKKAYEFYESRGYQHGRDQDDWIEAEKAVVAELKK